MTTLEPIPGIDPDEMVQEFNRPFEQLSQLVTNAKNSVEALVHHVKFSPFNLSPVAALWIKKSLKAIKEGLAKVVKLVADAVKHQAPVVSLIVQSFHWVNAVKKPMSNMSGMATNWSSNAYFGDWTGTAANLYRDKAKRQQDAMAAVTKKAEFISAWLYKIARANVDFMVELSGIATKFAGAFVTASIQAGSVLELPVALAKIAGAVGDVVTSGLDALGRIVQRFVDAMKDALDIANDTADQLVLPGGHWPQAVLPGPPTLANRFGPSVHPGF